MRRFYSASQGRSDSPGPTRRSSTRSVQDLQALRSSRRYKYSPECCSLNVLLALGMGALVVVILRTRHNGSQMKPEKQFFVFPVYATPLNVTWRGDAPFHNTNNDHPSSIFRGSLLRSLMADKKPEISNYISECVSN